MAIGDGGGQQPQGLSGADLARIRQSTSSSAPDPMDFDGLMDALLGWTGLFFSAVKTKADSLFNTGILAHIQVQQSAVEKSMNQAAQSLSMRGGKLEQILAVFKPEFSKIVAPQIAASMQDFSFSSLGSFSPMQTPSGGMGADHGLA